MASRIGAGWSGPRSAMAAFWISAISAAFFASAILIATCLRNTRESV
jgi:hypothetical protein